MVGLDFSVVGFDDVDDGLRLAVAAGKVGADCGVRAFDLVVDGLTQVVQQPGPLGQLGVRHPARSAMRPARWATSRECMRTFCP